MRIETATARQTADGTYEAMLTDAFQSYGDQVRRVISRICGTHDAADVTQEVFARLWTHQMAFDPQRGSIRQYLMTVARGSAIDHVRSQSAERSRNERDAAKRGRDNGRPIDDELIARERAARIVDALERLPPDQRDLICATFYGHQTYRAAAAAAGVPEGTAKSRIRLGLIRLRFDLHDLIETDDDLGLPAQ